MTHLNLIRAILVRPRRILEFDAVSAWRVPVHWPLILVVAAAMIHAGWIQLVGEFGKVPSEGAKQS